MHCKCKISNKNFLKISNFNMVSSLRTGVKKKKKAKHRAFPPLGKLLPDMVPKRHLESVHGYASPLRGQSSPVDTKQALAAAQYH